MNKQTITIEVSENQKEILSVLCKQKDITLKNLVIGSIALNVNNDTEIDNYDKIVITQNLFS